jgi:hypothetical protein
MLGLNVNSRKIQAPPSPWCISTEGSSFIAVGFCLCRYRAALNWKGSTWSLLQWHPRIRCWETVNGSISWDRLILIKPNRKPLPFHHTWLH